MIRISPLVSFLCFLVVTTTTSLLLLFNDILIHASQPCSAPLIPSDLDIASKVQYGDSRGIHLQGTYGLLNAEDSYNVAQQSVIHTINIPTSIVTDNNDAWFRMSISPNSFSTKLYLYDITNGDNQAVLVQSSASGGDTVEQQLFYVLGKGKKHRVVIGYNLGWKALRDSGCPSVIIELAVQDATEVPHFTDSCWNDAPPKVGVIDPRNGEDLYFKFQQDNPSFAAIGKGAYSHDYSSSATNTPFHVIASYDVIVPHLPGRHQKWKFRAAVHANFIDGGDVSLILLNTNFTTIPEDQRVTPDSCANGQYDCTYAHRSLKNMAIVQEALMAGNDGRLNEYRLFLISRRREDQIEKTCFPYTLSVDFFPLPSQDTFVNCEADPLVDTFNSPGLYNNNTGVMRYRVPVLVNLTNRVQKARFMTTKPKSIMRAWISAQRTVDADIYLWSSESTGPIAYSMASFSPDGFVAVLKSGIEYTFEIALASGHKKDDGVQDLEFSQLCDFFELQVHVFPFQETVWSDDDHSCRTNLPDFESIADDVYKTLSEQSEVPIYETGVTSYNTWPYTYRIDSNNKIRQEVIAHFQLRLPKSALMAMTLSSDSYHGTPIIEMVLANGDATDVLYSRHRSVGSYMYSDLEIGVYNITIKTPYTQFEFAKTWQNDLPDVPTCVKFNFHLSLGDAAECVAALPAPLHIVPGTANHHHIGDIFRIKPFVTQHDIAITAPVDSILHFQSDESTSDIAAQLLDARDTSRVIQVGKIVSSKHQEHGKLVELFAGISGDNKGYILRLAFDTGANSNRRDYCRRFAMELSIVPVPPVPETGSVDYQCDEASGVQDFGTLELPAEAKEIDAWKPNQIKGPYIVKFKIDQPAHIRMTMLYDFTQDAPSMKLCPCADPLDTWCSAECLTGDLFFNGLEIPTTTLLAGTYTIALEGWSEGIGSEIAGDVAKITTMCHRFMLHLAIEPFVAKIAPAMCPTRMQYLPRNLNMVGLLSPYYHNQLHFLQELKLSASRQGDKTTFTIEREPSIIRMQIPENDFGIGADLLLKDASTGKFQALDYGYQGTSIYAVLQPGTYELSLDYVFQLRGTAALQNDGCVSVPIEVSIVPASDIQHKLSTSSSVCDESPEFPTEMKSHDASIMMYRSPQRDANSVHQYEHKIDFHIQEDIGAFVTADLRFSFEAGGLQMSLHGSELQANGEYAHNRSYTVTRVPNRASIDVYLQKGRYTLRVWDPVSVTRYARVGPTNIPTCTRFSLYLANSDSGNTNNNNGKPPTLPPVPNSPPSNNDIACNYIRYDFLPTSMPATQGSGSSEWATISGDSFPIPFDSAVAKQQAVGNWVVNYYVIEIPITFDVSPGEYVRIWFRSKTIGTPEISIVDPNAGATALPVARGKWFGRHTVSISYFPSEMMSKLQLKIKLVYTELPRYGTDYKTCSEKRHQTTFELLFSRFPVSHVQSMVTCPPQASARSNLPPTTINGVSTTQGDFYITGADIKAYLTARNRFSDEDGNGGSAFSILPTFEHKIRVTLPEDNMYIMLFLDFNLLVSEFRAYFLFAGNNSVLRNNNGNPIGSVDEKYDASLFVHAARLPKGDYDIVIVQANAENRLKNAAEYCIAFRGEIMVGGGSSWNHNHSANRNTAFVNRVAPPSTTNIDASDSLVVALDFNEDADVASLPHSKDERTSLAFLEDSTGARVSSSSMWFTSARELNVVFLGSTLKWNWNYQFKFDATKIKTKADSTKTFVVDPQLLTHGDAVTLATYRTATCGCTQFGVSCALGGMCPCQEPSGVTCNACEEGSFLSDHRQVLGASGDPLQTTGLICEAQHGGWHPTVSPGSHTWVPTARSEVAPDGNHGTAPPTDSTHNGTSHISGKMLPPLRFLRRFLSIGALLFVSVYVGMLLWNYRKQLQSHAHNPFRMLSTGGDGDEMNNNNSNNNNNPFSFGRSNQNSQNNNNSNNTNGSAVATSTTSNHVSTGIMDDDEDDGMNAVHEAAH